MAEQNRLTADDQDLTGLTWRKSTFSGHREDCVEVAAAAWHKSSLSGPNGDCVEVAPTPNIVAVRDSRDRSGPVLTFAAGEWTAFLSGIRAGEFDL